MPPISAPRTTATHPLPGPAPAGLAESCLAATEVTGLILAGGAARRMQTDGQDIDKGLMLLGGHPLVVWQIQQLAPQVGRLLLSANRNLAHYRRFGCPVVVDRFPGRPGPLAGIQAALSEIQSPWLAVSACDTPFLPPDWVSVLLGQAQRQQRPIAYACDDEQEHPLVALIHRSLLPAFEQALREDNRRVRQLYRQHGAIAVHFADAAAFFNINTPDAWQQARVLIASRAQPSAPAARPTEVLPAAPSCFSEAPMSPTPIQAGSPAPSCTEAGHMPGEPGTAQPAFLPVPDLHTAIAGIPDFDPNAVSVDEARAILARWVPTPVTAESLPLAECLGRVLAQSVQAPFDLPPHDNAAMDGYALRHADLAETADGGCPLPVGGTTLAGDAPATLPPGHAWRIMTGAPMPAGADTVVPQEEVEQLPPSSATLPAPDAQRPDQTGQPAPAMPGIRISGRVRAGQHVRRRGEDMRVGDAALPAGRRLMPADIGVAASLGLERLSVFRRLRIGVLSTGNELLQPGQRPTAEGQIYDSNRHALMATLRMQGFEPMDLGSLPDRPDALGQTLQQAAPQLDVILSTGGAAGGDADFIQQVTAAHGEARAWKLRMRPGRPLVLGRLGGCLLFGLPGNPVAALISQLFILHDALRQMAGAAPQHRPALRARAGCAFDKRPGRSEYHRVRLHYNAAGEPVAQPTGSQSSAMMRSLADADGIAVLPPACGPINEDDWIEVIPMHGLLSS